jgi:hypothetical protein
MKGGILSERNIKGNVKLPIVKLGSEKLQQYCSPLCTQIVGKSRDQCNLFGALMKSGLEGFNEPQLIRANYCRLSEVKDHE